MWVSMNKCFRAASRKYYLSLHHTLNASVIRQKLFCHAVNRRVDNVTDNGLSEIDACEAASVVCAVLSTILRQLSIAICRNYLAEYFQPTHLPL